MASCSGKPHKPVVLITGCSEGGLGYYFCLEYAAKGCHVFATARNPKSMDSLRSNSNIECLVLDVTQRSQVEEVVAEILSRTGRIDVLVNNAGGFVGSFGSIVEADLAPAKGTFEVNFWGTCNMVQVVGRHMVERRSGHIINNGSMMSRLPQPFGAWYCSSKWAVEGLTHTLRNEMRPFGVKVSYLAAGLIHTNIMRPAQLDSKAPPGSPFAQLLALYAAAMTKGIHRDGMPADEFVRYVVAAMLVRNPPAVWFGGPPARILQFLSWLLPHVWFDKLLHLMFQIPWPGTQVVLPVAASATG